MSTIRTNDKQTLLRHLPEHKQDWEIARRAAEARRYPNGEGHLSMQEWMLEVLNKKASDTLLRAQAEAEAYRCGGCDALVYGPPIVFDRIGGLPEKVCCDTCYFDGQ